MRLFIFEIFFNRRQSEPVVPETPPALDEKLSEERLRHMFHLGVIAGYKQRKEEEELTHRARIASLSTLKQKPAQPVVSMPVQAPSKAQQTPLQFPNRAGGWMHTERARQRVAAKIGTAILPVRPKPYNVPTFAELPVVRRRNWPDAG